ncbi:transcriptional repressor, partial [Candidatus Poribacteria bacterium]|nr:transcriptional repressor [Candidatus Poribacteria bacterium]
MKELSEGLRQEGYRFTRQRQIILEEVQRQQSHPSAKEVYDAVKLRLPNISLGTIYRGLGVLVELGLIRKVEHGEYARFDANLVDHHHLICICLFTPLPAHGTIGQGGRRGVGDKNSLG